MPEPAFKKGQRKKGGKRRCKKGGQENEKKKGTIDDGVYVAFCRDYYRGYRSSKSFCGPRRREPVFGS